jgi:hypothetical protein
MESQRKQDWFQNSFNEFKSAFIVGTFPNLHDNIYECPHLAYTWMADIEMRKGRII